ncbi:uncharacterized protein LOC114530414 [Dendronephthya gigantea]|uniref:uncharacterized protein LOC114530414 n=1 Tax=Dendronephthya gigantea TaxID=151771 RepID=UPI0010698678|nr:uncharacterized protein LOC114530414 [Dendronephthya gigantea]
MQTWNSDGFPKFKGRRKKQNNNELLSCIKLACPQFHVYGHGATCQLMCSPRRLDGWGLVDGEVLERLWSYLRLFRKMTKEMSASHREDILSDALYYYTKRQRSKTVLLLRVQHKRCQELSNSACIELEDLRKKSPVPVTDEMVTEWKQREKEYLRKSRPEEVDLGPHNWVLEYFSLLRQYYSARNQVSEGVDDSRYNHVMAVMSSLNNRLLRMETEHGIQSRWTPTSGQYLH